MRHRHHCRLNGLSTLLVLLAITNFATLVVVSSCRDDPDGFDNAGTAHRTGLPIMSTAALLAILAGLVLIIASCAFGVVRQAEAIARRLPDPYGTLVLTLSIVLIEVVLISAVMLGPGQHATIARDSVMAVMMTVLNLVVGQIGRASGRAGLWGS